MTISELHVDEDGLEKVITRPIQLYGIQFQKLLFESYFIRKGFVKLTLSQLRNMEWKYAWRLWFVMRELDMIEAEKQKEEMERARRRH